MPPDVYTLRRNLAREPYRLTPSLGRFCWRIFGAVSPSVDILLSLAATSRGPPRCAGGTPAGVYGEPGLLTLKPTAETRRWCGPTSVSVEAPRTTWTETG